MAGAQPALRAELPRCRSGPLGLTLPLLASHTWAFLLLICKMIGQFMALIWLQFLVFKDNENVTRCFAEAAVPWAVFLRKQGSSSDVKNS